MVSTVLPRRSLLNLSAALLLGLLAAGPLAAVPTVGQPAPDFTITDSNGVSQTLSKQRGNIVVLEWTNHECPFVVKHYSSDNMQTLQKEAKDQKVVWWSVISSAPGKEGHVTAAEANELSASRQAAPSAVLLDPDGTVGKLYGARTTPHIFIIDAKGTLVYMGGIDDKPSTRVDDVKGATNYVRTTLAALKEGKPVDPATTRPYGCSVKY